MNFDQEKAEDAATGYRDALNHELDTGLAPYIRAINQNPNVRTVQTCSGHSGHPYLNIEVRSAVLASQLSRKFTAAGFAVYGTGGRELYIEIPDTTTREAFNDTRVRWKRFVKGRRIATPQESVRFWNTVTRILSSPTSYGLGLSGRVIENQGFREAVENTSAQSARDVVEDAMCINCSQPASHRHGKHPCCGRSSCHTKISFAHLAYGERGVSRGLKSNPYRF